MKYIKRIIDALRYKIVIAVVIVRKEPKVLKYCRSCRKYKPINDFRGKSNHCNICKSSSAYKKVDKIIKIICKYSNVKYDMFMSNHMTRNPEYVKIRQRSHYFAKEYTILTLAQIGAYIQRKDHSTVIHSRTTVLNMTETNKEYAKEIEIINNEIKRRI